MSRLKNILPVVLVLLPLVFLLGDYLRTPVLLNGCKKSDEHISLQDLSNKQHVKLGRYRGHIVHFSLDSFRDGEYFTYLEGAPNGLVVVVDHENLSQPVWGGLTRKVLDKLDTVSASDAAALRAVISGTEPQSGHAKSLSLHLPQGARSAFPIDDLYILGIRARGASDGKDRKQQIDILQHGLNEAVDHAGRDGIANLIVPNIGVDPGDPATLRAADLYPIVFAAAAQPGRPHDLYISIYHGWALADQAAAIDAVQSAWDEACRALQSDTYLVNEQVRLVVATLFVCLLVCSRHVPISLKNWLIITAAFIGLGLGAWATMELFIKDWHPGSRCIAHAALLLVLAVLFPFLPKMNPENIFDPKGGTS